MSCEMAPAARGEPEATVSVKRLRFYIDTSIIGGCLDEEFAAQSRALLAMAADGRATLILSDVLATELRRAPDRVQAIVASLPDQCTERVESTPEVERLRDAYLQAGVLGPGSTADAHHVAMATVMRADLIVSWNFKHIVHFDKIRGFNAVNLREGYAPISIHSPSEVV